MAVIDARIGMLAPLRHLPGELSDVIAQATERVAHWEVITGSTETHDFERLSKYDEGLVEGIAELRRWGATAAAWACTIGSFFGGRAHALEQVREMEAAGGFPCTSTSLAFVEALAALGIGEVSVVGPYPERSTAAFVGFLEEWGVAVVASAHLGYDSGADSERLGSAEVERALGDVRTDVPVLLPDTAVWGLEIQRELDGGLPVPLIVANQVTLWHVFDLAGVSTSLPAFGTLSGMRSPGVTRIELAR